ncbi:hypothetical protein [Rickettsia tamurae]|uniref:hypothetical protein n=1 Tax=Rickettsia tamurae TaxID=334545 RepID=UPI001F2F3A32|nr:hypothetical protein [Rickettsia tamurae]
MLYGSVFSSLRGTYKVIDEAISGVCYYFMRLLRGPVKPTVSPVRLTTGSIKTIKNTNNFSIFNWIPWSSHGMTEVKLIHATIPIWYPPNNHINRIQNIN